MSAPKDVSVLAMVGGDQRIVDAFHDSVKIALEEMERFAA
ncbi:MAG: relaxase domain-containing protein, partial [Gemmatimonadota bacterium]